MSFSTNKPMIEGTPQTSGNGQMPRGGDDASAINLQVVRSLRLRPKLAAVVAAVVLAVVVGYALLQKSQYTAESQLYVMPTAIKLLGGGSGNLDEGQYETFLAEQMLLVTRPDVLKAALDSLPHATWAEFGGTEQDVVGNLTTLLKVQRVGTSRQVSISLKGSDPVKTAAVVNAITSAYLEAAHKATTADSDQRGQLLAEEKQRIEGELQADRTEQIALGASIGVANPSVEGGNPYDSGLSGIRMQLSEARAAHEVAAAQLAALSGVGPAGTSGLMAAADEQIMSDAGLASMKASVSQRKAQVTAQMAGMTPTNPVYKQDQDEMADLDRTLDKMTADVRDKTARRMQDKLHSDLQRTGDVESRLNGQLARQIATATSAAPRLQRATEVQADIQRLGTQLATVDDALRSLHMEVSGPAQVRLSQPATPPERPEANRTKQLLLLALPLAILCGIGAAVLARMRDKRILIGLDVADVLGFPPLVVLPARSEVSQRVFEEYVLRLAAGIESAHRTGGARTFLLTAVSLTTDIGPIATALTRKFKEIGVNVVIATASDMLSPSEGVQSAGSEPMSSDELARTVEFWSEGFVAANVAKMKAEHGLVLIESEALLNCAQTEYVARCADVTILIVESGVTTRPELLRAAELLHRLNVVGMGAILEEIQLRYADADFRDAIEALERRQSEPLRQDRRARVEVAPAEVTPAEVVPTPEIAPPTPEALVSEPETQPSPVPEEVAQEVAAAIAQDPTLLETEEDRVASEYEPSDYHEVLHHFRATQPVDHDLEWHLPVFGQIPAHPNPAPVAEQPIATVQPIATIIAPEAEVVAALPVVAEAMQDAVENPSHSGPFALEATHSGSVVDAAIDSLHEKMSPRLSARLDQPTPAGDPGMTRKTSWIGRLLSRNAAPIVSIIPDAGNDVPDEIAPAVPLPSSRLPLKPEVTRTQATGEDDYDASLVNRLDQISGTRQAASVHAPATDISEFKESHRLQIAPPETVADEPIPTFAEAVSEAVASVEEVPVPVAEIVPSIRKGPAGWAKADETVAESAAVVEPAVSAEVEPAQAAAAAPVARGPRRPLTFHELMQLTEREAAAPVVAQAIELPEPSRAAVQSAELQPIHAIPFEVLGNVSDYDPVVPVVEAVAAEPVLHVPAPAIEEAVPEIAAAHVAEPAAVQVPEPVRELVHEVAAIPEAAPVVEPVPERLPEPMAAEVPEFHFSNRYVEQLKKPEADDPTFDPYPSHAFELDDIEPVYQEASRNLNTGRWDPIPPLRPSMDNWRDRPSPMPTYGNRGGKPTNGTVKDGFNAYPPQRWIPEETPPVVPEPAPLSEPMLSRQWGLLSKFQQSRLSSASHPVAKVEPASDSESGRDADRPGSPYGDRRS